ncbi:MAG: hypothetical protein Q9214_000200 [Letrouitia sp. 1 TL-2023]
MKIVVLSAVLSALSLTAAYPNRIHEGARHLEDRSHRVHFVNSTTSGYPAGTASPTQDIHARVVVDGLYPAMGSPAPAFPHYYVSRRHHIPTGAESAPTGIVARHLGTGVSKGTPGPAPTSIVARHLGTGVSTGTPAATGIVARDTSTAITTVVLRTATAVSEDPTTFRALTTKTTTETISGPALEVVLSGVSTVSSVRTVWPFNPFATSTLDKRHLPTGATTNSTHQ